MTVIEYNKQLRQEYERTRTVDSLEKYIISETLSPISDFNSAINIIRSNYLYHINTSLLFVGAYLITKWTTEDNEMLVALNCIYSKLPNKQKAIVCFLNAYHMYIRDSETFSGTKYKEWLLESISLDEHMVNSRILLAELFNGLEAVTIYKKAIDCIEKVQSAQEILDLDVEYLANIEEFINEHIIGIHITEANMRILQNKIQSRIAEET